MAELRNCEAGALFIEDFVTMYENDFQKNKQLGFKTFLYNAT